MFPDHILSEEIRILDWKFDFSNYKNINFPILCVSVIWIYPLFYYVDLYIYIFYKFDKNPLDGSSK